MRKYIKNFSNCLFPIALIGVCSTASAYDWIFDYAKASTGTGKIAMTLSASYGTASEEGTGGYWYYLNGDNKVYINGGTIGASDTISVGSNTGPTK